MNNLIFICLAFATLSTWVNTIFIKNITLQRVSQSTVFLSNGLIIATIIDRWLKNHYFPLSNLYESILFLCCMLLTGQLVAEKILSTRLISCLNLPLVLGLYRFGSTILPSSMRSIQSLAPSLQSNWLMMHVSVMMLSYAVLLLGSSFCILYLILELVPKKLDINTKEKSIDYINKTNTTNVLTTTLISNEILNKKNEVFEQSLPRNLSTLLDIWSYRLIGFGFPFLTLGIISGAVWANEAWGAYWSWDPKENWALVTWLIFAIYLHARLIKGWTGKKIAIVGCIGFVIIWVCYLGVNFLGHGLHTYGLLN